ncbi:hypothetical protein A2899_04880 [Candidatus Amesbacteria bacterium RIFCSPLOWO2_01_FULL_49_25]|uniref:Type II secretion system protein GspG C-terminal domain-containing protein n=1 Tax=Candidatus Amesbacteria bacterium RIFCSPHIGHO2_01_FULL_48_32b TaxID=1797253 RepID=A0A1F4YE74_9BACT|nr:MAG: hypothetical protein A2876_04415 [Candidatus Amesbacteria bacterium RIFCSPHIGHO2_01_FULL_48_32b]OGD07914.1 MAG: hypothetical protein A2899_04880 [Candidatus Amesbacteria bacterium RIFCSPLOWO2_01_FULL_49_25]
MGKIKIDMKKAFTLIELLVVIGVLAILLTITLIAINPARQFAQSNNTRRRSDINAMLNAIHQYSVDNRGTITPLGIPVDDGDPLNGSEALVIGSGVGQVDICALLVPTYISALPVDPQDGSSSDGNGAPVSDCTQAYDTAYTVVQSAVATNIRITVAAPGAEIAEIITVTR